MNPDREANEKAALQWSAKSGYPYFDTRDLQVLPRITEISTDEMLALHVAPLERFSETSLEFGLTSQTDRARLPEMLKKFPGIQITFKAISTIGCEWIANSLYLQTFAPAIEGNFKSFSDRLASQPPKSAFGLIAQLAYLMGASDIHIEPQAEVTRIRFRLDGTLHPITNVNTEAYKVFLADLQTKAHIKWGSDAPQSGRMTYTLVTLQATTQTISVRIETIPALHGEEIVVRLFNTESKQLDLLKMGYSEDQIKRIANVTSHPHGMALTVGPTGSGKTSTLYAILNGLNSPDVKIVTLEDPVEYDLPGVTQIPVKSEDNELFAQKLRAVLREDPNVIMIGEIRDVDTAKTALQASLTGHLVLSTFHADSTASAITRMIDMIGQNPLFASAVRLIIAQRLARRICTSCIAVHEATEEEMAFLKDIVVKLPTKRQPDLRNISLKYGKGCPVCHGLGFKGRIALIEMMFITPDIEKMMTTGTRATSQEIEEAAVKNGMVTLMEDAVMKVLAGLTTVEEIMVYGQ